MHLQPFTDWIHCCLTTAVWSRLKRIPPRGRCRKSLVSMFFPAPRPITPVKSNALIPSFVTCTFWPAFTFWGVYFLMGKCRNPGPEMQRHRTVWFLVALVVRRVKWGNVSEGTRLGEILVFVPSWVERGPFIWVYLVMIPPWSSFNTSPPPPPTPPHINDVFFESHWCSLQLLRLHKWSRLWVNIIVWRAWDLGSGDGELAGVQARSKHGSHDPAQFTDGIFRSQKLILKILTTVGANCSWCQSGDPTEFTGERWSVKVTYLRVQCKTKERNQASELG